MPNDAKLGMVFGVVLVVVIAVVFFRKDPTVPVSAEGTVPVAAAGPPSPTPDPKNRVARKHRVQEGDTLATLAQHYLNDDSRTADLRRANPGLIPDNGDLKIGQELVIPD